MYDIGIGGHGTRRALQVRREPPTTPQRNCPEADLSGALRRPGAALRGFGVPIQTSAAVRPQKPLYRATHPSPITVVEIVVGIAPY